MDYPEKCDLKVDGLRQQVEAAENELHRLRLQLHQAELAAKTKRPEQHTEEGLSSDSEYRSLQKGTDQLDLAPDLQNFNSSRWPLAADEYKRYGRQLIMPEIGLAGQLSLRNARILIIGLGGLGCPAAAYLAGAGVGTLGLIDGDTVELSNLHRQIAHSTDRTGMLKVDSASEYLRSYVANATQQRPFVLIVFFLTDLILVPL